MIAVQTRGSVILWLRSLVSIDIKEVSGSFPLITYIVHKLITCCNLCKTHRIRLSIGKMLLRCIHGGDEI